MEFLWEVQILCDLEHIFNLSVVTLGSHNLNCNEILEISIQLENTTCLVQTLTFICKFLRHFCQHLKMLHFCMQTEFAFEMEMNYAN